MKQDIFDIYHAFEEFNRDDVNSSIKRGLEKLFSGIIQKTWPDKDNLFEIIEQKHFHYIIFALITEEFEFSKIFKLEELFTNFEIGGVSIGEVYEVISNILISSDRSREIKRFIDLAMKSNALKDVSEKIETYELVIPNFICKDLKDTLGGITSMFDQVKEFRSQNLENLFDNKIYSEYAAKFGLKIQPDQISINAIEMIKTLLELSYNNQNCATDLVYLLLPICREIPLASELIHLGINIAKGNRDEILAQVGSLVKICWIMSGCESK